MTKKSRIGLAVAGGLIVILAAICVTLYNGLVKTREAVDGEWAQVQSMLQRRADLIPNLVETVKGYAAHEKQVFTDVAEARSRLLAARGAAEAARANQQLEAGLGRLLAIVERYPDLKANQTFLKLQDELADSENRIAAGRNRFNDAVRAFNVKIRRFPARVLAALFRFHERPYFQAEEAARPAPKVELGARG